MKSKAGSHCLHQEMTFMRLPSNPLSAALHFDLFDSFFQTRFPFEINDYRRLIEQLGLETSP